MIIDMALQPTDLSAQVKRVWELSAGKIRSIDESWSSEQGAPVFTVQGKYTARGWTEWTQGFQYGSSILYYDATGDKDFLQRGRENTIKRMAAHITHFGVHDHGFNNISTYGNLWRLMNEGRIAENPTERDFYELALKASGAVQAKRWTRINDGTGFIYSFNGPHSLFADTLRSLRSLAVAHLLGHQIMDERDTRISLLERLVQHAAATAKYGVYYGTGRDIYDVYGRVAHESIFNVNDGNYRCPNSQQGYSPFTTWTRGLAWIMLGYTEQLEFFRHLPDAQLENVERQSVEEMMLNAARATCDFYIENTATDGIPFWDTGAPGLAKMGDYLNRKAEPYNDYEPVDSSAAAIAAQALLRLGHYLGEEGKRYHQAGLTVLKTLFAEPYLSSDPNHQGLLLHSIYHRPNGWDYIPPGCKIPCGESCMWGDYHAQEVALYLQRIIENKPYYTFFGPGDHDGRGS